MNLPRIRELYRDLLAKRGFSSCRPTNLDKKRRLLTASNACRETRWTPHGGGQLEASRTSEDCTLGLQEGSKLGHFSMHILKTCEPYSRVMFALLRDTAITLKQGEKQYRRDECKVFKNFKNTVITSVSP
jgi:hypothetical protein